MFSVRFQDWELTEQFCKLFSFIRNLNNASRVATNHGHDFFDFLHARLKIASIIVQHLNTNIIPRIVQNIALRIYTTLYNAKSTNGI